MKKQKTLLARKQSEPAHLLQGNVVPPSSVLPRFPLCLVESNGNENFKVMQNLGFLPDHPQNLITGSLCHSRHTLKISENCDNCNRRCIFMFSKFFI